MKVLTFTLLIFSMKGTFLTELKNQDALMPLLEPNLPGRYEKCIKLLAVILAESTKLAALIAAKNFVKAIPLAIKLAGQIVEDIHCFKTGLGEEKVNKFLNFKPISKIKSNNFNYFQFIDKKSFNESISF